jgi:hypothetical protein
MSYYLLVYDRGDGRLLEERSFVSRREALTARFDAEARRLPGSDIEVVVLGASSRDALQRTHGRYFSTSTELAGATTNASA